MEFTSNTAEVAVAEDAPTITFPFTVALVKVPTLVKLELITVDASVFPVNVPAAAAPTEAAAEVHVVPLDVKTLPLAPGATACKVLVPLPNKTLLAARVVAPVPPLATVNIPVIFEAAMSVTFESVIAPAAIFAVVTALFAIVNAAEPFTSPVWVALVTNPLYKLFTALSPVFVPDKFATAVLANILLLMDPLAIEVALPVLVTTPVKFALVVTVAAFPPIFKPTAVPVILVPTKADGVPKAGLIIVGEVLMTTFPVPVISFDTIFLLISVNKAFEAVAVDKTGADENVFTPAIVWAVVKSTTTELAVAHVKVPSPVEVNT